MLYHPALPFDCIVAGWGSVGAEVIPDQQICYFTVIAMVITSRVNYCATYSYCFPQGCGCLSTLWHSPTRTDLSRAYVHLQLAPVLISW